MKKIKVEIPQFAALTYTPTALALIGAFSMVLLGIGDAVNSLWIKIPLLLIAGLIQMGCLWITIYILYSISKIHDKGKK